jgi:hypothetical protein
MRRWFSFIHLLITCGLAINLAAHSQESTESLERKRLLGYYADESRIDELVVKFSTTYRQQDVVVRNVTLISVGQGRAVPGQAVLVQNGRITRIGSSTSLKSVPGARIIDAHGLYLVPGLFAALIHGHGSIFAFHSPVRISGARASEKVVEAMKRASRQ